MFRCPRNRVNFNAVSCSSSALASLRTGVSRPSVNQLETGASRSWASVRLPWSRQRRAKVGWRRAARKLCALSLRNGEHLMSLPARFEPVANHLLDEEGSAQCHANSSGRVSLASEQHERVPRSSYGTENS